MMPRKMVGFIIAVILATLGVVIYVGNRSDQKPSSVQTATSRPVVDRVMIVCDRVTYVQVAVTPDEFDPTRFTNDLAVCDASKNPAARKAQARRDREQEIKEENLEAFRAGLIQELSKLADDDARAVRIVQLACAESRVDARGDRFLLSLFAELYDQYYSENSKLPSEFGPTLFGGEGVHASKSTLNEVCL